MSLAPSGLLLLSGARQILLRQHLAFLDRRLIEGIDAEEVRRDDRLQHEMHEQLAQRCLLERVDVYAAHRAAVLGEGLDGGAALCGDEVADGLAGEIRLARKPREIIRNARTAAGGADRDDGEELVAGTGEIELQLAVLVDRSKRRDRGGALAVLAETLGPQLHVPAREALEPVRIGEHHAHWLRGAERDR